MLRLGLGRCYGTKCLGCVVEDAVGTGVMVVTL
jgi:hypothetical protein